MNSIDALHTYGQSIWLDYISRSLLTGGGLKDYILKGVSGVTSNPSIFQKSICDTGDYTQSIKEIVASKPGLDVMGVYEDLAAADIRMACDQLLSIYQKTGGTDGFVSLEVSPEISDMTEKTIIEAKRYWKMIDRPNLMIKVPATPAGVPAIESLIAAGINVNATLIFSLKQYEDTANAYIRGLAKNPQPVGVASVASFFVSRIDTAIDKALEKTGTPEALAQRGKAAVACSKMVYRRLTEIFASAEFEIQKARGGKVQKMVWGSTGTKNLAYSDVIYVEEIIGPDTINTIPTSTLNAFLDHGKARLSITEGVKEAESYLGGLKKYGIDLDAVTEQLLKEGVQSFVQAFRQMLGSLKERYSL